MEVIVAIVLVVAAVCVEAVAAGMPWWGVPIIVWVVAWGVVAWVLTMLAELNRAAADPPPSTWRRVGRWLVFMAAFVVVVPMLLGLCLKALAEPD